MIYFDRRWDGATGIGRFCREVAARLDGITALPVTGNPASGLDCIRLTLFMLLHPRAVVVSPGYSAPLLGLSRFVLTVHDLNHIDIAHNSGALKRLYYRLVLRRACRKAAKVLTVSEFSRSRIMAWADVPGTQVECVGNGVSEIFAESAKNDVTRPAADGFLFCVGNRKGHKNEAAVLRSLALLKDHPALRVVFSGEPSKALLEAADALQLSDRVGFTGPLSESALADLYRDAAMLVFPSLYEGFGLPAVEAMAAGCPVVASSTTALGEIAAGASVEVDPESDASIAEAIARVADSTALREALQLQGYARCKLYSWDLVGARVRRVVASLS